MGSKINAFISALKELGDGRYHYWNGSSGVGCSDYVRLALGKAGIITQAEANSSQSLWAGQGIVGVLADTSRFKKLSAAETQQVGDIQWFQGAHVSVYAGGNNDRWEASPEGSHGICANGKSGVGLWKNHTYNCAGIPMTCIYRIVEQTTPSRKQTAKELCDNAIKLCTGGYGKTGILECISMECR